MNRLPDWLDRLNAVVESCADRRFEWGAFDCAHFVAQCVDAMCSDSGARACLLYQDERAALKWIKEGGGIKAIATSFLGDPVPWGLVRRGDVMLMDNCGRNALGICLGSHVVLPAPRGLSYLRAADGLCGWRVG